MSSISNSWLETNQERKAHLERIERLAEACNHNMDSLACAEAADRLMEGNAAFWCTSGASDQFTGGIVALANMYGNLGRACLERNWRRRGDADAEKMLDRLIPLNHAAMMQLERAYRIIGTFRTFGELSSRASKIMDRASVPAKVAG